MSTASDEPELSSLELRSKLFETFRRKGILQSVKSQLRNRLAFELQGQLKTDSASQYGKAQNDCSLFQQISNNLVMNHLKESEYNYTLSVFVTESLTNPDQPINIKDTLHMLQIHPESKLYHEVIKECNDTFSKQSFLYKFLHLLSMHKSSGLTNSSTQTQEEYTADKMGLDAKLKEVELALKRKMENRESENLESKLLSYQRKYEAQKKTELKAEIERFKSSQLSMMRIEEKDNYQKEVNKIKEQYEQRYRKQLGDLEKREKEWKEQCERQKQVFEKEAYEKRQKILADLQNLKVREIQIDKNNEMAMKSIGVEEENLRARREHLRYKEESLNDIERRYEERLQNEIIKMKYELQMEGKQHTEHLQMQEQQLRENKINFEAQKDIYLQWKKEAEKLKLQNEEQHIALLTSRETITALNQKVGTLTERCKKICNYEEVVNLNKLLERDLALLQKNFDNLNVEKAQREKEHQKMIKDLMKKSSRSKELETAKDKEGYFREKYYELQDKLQVEISKNEDLKKLNEDLLLSQRETLREIDELRVALQIAKQEKEKLQRVPYQRSSLRTHPVSLNTSTLRSPSFAVKRNLWSEDDIINHHNPKELPSPQLLEEEEDKSDMLAKLEKEAKELERSYKDFKERQKMEVKSVSRVHFDPLVRRRTASNSNTTIINNTDITRTLEIGLNDDTTLNTYNPPSLNPLVTHNFGKHTTHVTEKSSSLVPSSNGTILPLSSTQAPGESDPAPSFGLSLVSEPSHVKTSLPSLLISTTAHDSLPNLQRPATTITCYSLTQHPLGDVTENQTNIGTQSNYTLYDTRNTLTQYPLGDTDLHTVVEKPQEEEEEKKSRSSFADFSSFNSNPLNRNKTSSVNSDLELKETTIDTFESPLKNAKVVKPVEDIFYTPAKGVTIGVDTISSAHSKDGGNISSALSRDGGNTSSAHSKDGGNISSARSKDERSSISSRDEGSMKEIDLQTESISDACLKSAALSGKVDLGEENLSSLKEENNAEETTKENEENDMMAKYMQMVLQKKEEEKREDEEKPKDEGPTKSDDQFDIPLSEEEDIAKDDTASSDYEW